MLSRNAQGKQRASMNLSLLMQNHEHEGGKNNTTLWNQKPIEFVFLNSKIRFANFSTLGLTEYKNILTPDV